MTGFGAPGCGRKMELVDPVVETGEKGSLKGLGGISASCTDPISDPSPLRSTVEEEGDSVVKGCCLRLSDEGFGVNSSDFEPLSITAKLSFSFSSSIRCRMAEAIPSGVDRSCSVSTEAVGLADEEATFELFFTMFKGFALANEGGGEEVEADLVDR